MDPRTATPHPFGQLLMLGVAQAVLFVVGGVLGRWIGMLLGCDALAPQGWGAREIAGVVLLAGGAGGGAQLARALYVRRYGNPGRH